VNDVFMVNSTNITEITCIIFDRWGVKMYDVTSKTGNIAWDGKNLSGKDVPTGTYFYIITAKGLDDLPYEQKGTVSLYR
jgi:gliding motility-associated-like protein